jgi:hypothetical protein
MLLCFFRLSILALEIGERHVQCLVAEPDADRPLRRAIPLNFRIADQPLTMPRTRSDAVD